MSTKKTLGTTIKKARKELGLSQKEFAHILHVSDKTVSAYEVDRAMPGFDMMQKISTALNKPISYFDTSAEIEDLDLEIKLRTIEKELLEVKKLLKKRG